MNSNQSSSKNITLFMKSENTLDGLENNLSTPPISFHCIKRFVGGAMSNDATISLKSFNCSLIVCPSNSINWSTMSFRLRRILTSFTPGGKRFQISKCFKLIGRKISLWVNLDY